MDKQGVVHIYNGILIIKKNDIMPFDPGIITLSEVRQISHDSTYITKKMMQINLFTK